MASVASPCKRIRSLLWGADAIEVRRLFMAGMVLHSWRVLGSHALRVAADVRAGLFRPRCTLDWHNGGGQEFDLSAVHYGHHASAEGPGPLRLRAGLPNCSPYDRPIPRDRLLGDREGVEEVIFQFSDYFLKGDTNELVYSRRIS